MKLTTLIRWIVACSASLVFAAPAFADVIVVPPPDSPCTITDNYKNHGDYVSCMAAYPELWTSDGNSDAGTSDIGK